MVLDGKIDKKAIIKLIKDTKAILVKEPNVVEIEGKITIVGDVHGQFHDTVSMLDEVVPKFDEQKDTGLLFLGDYVDRGIMGVEVLIYLMALKINYRKQITLLRGNHETRNMTESFTFRQECIDKYDQEVYDHFMELFDSFPIASVVNGLYLCVHGGISPDLYEVSELDKLNRF